MRRHYGSGNSRRKKFRYFDQEDNVQCQCEWGHGYMLDENTVQLSVCEFITAGNCSIVSAINAKSGDFLRKRYVVSAQVIDSIQICD